MYEHDEQQRQSPGACPRSSRPNSWHSPAGSISDCPTTSSATGGRRFYAPATAARRQIAAHILLTNYLKYRYMYFKILPYKLFKIHVPILYYYNKLAPPPRARLRSGSHHAQSLFKNLELRLLARRPRSPDMYMTGLGGPARLSSHQRTPPVVSLQPTGTSPRPQSRGCWEVPTVVKSLRQ